MSETALVSQLAFVEKVPEETLLPRLAFVEKDRYGYYQAICMATNAVLMSAISRDRATAERWATSRGYFVRS